MFGIIDGKNSSTAYIILYKLIYIWVWTRTGGWEFDRSHGTGTSSPSHWQQVGEQAPKPVGWVICFLVMTFVAVQKLCVDMYIYIYIYYPLYTNWPITNANLPHVIIQYILYFICQKLYWTVSGQLSNIGYIGQFQNEATGTLRTRYRRTKAVSMYLMKI